MSDSTQPKQDWILGPGCNHPLGRLWNSFQLKLLGKANDSSSKARFSEFRLKSLGPTESEISQCLFDFEQINVVTNPGLLKSIEARFKDKDGRSLQGLLTADINSRVLVDVESEFPEAPVLISEAIALLDSLVPWTGKLMKTMISWVIPIYHEKYNRPFRRGFSHLDYLGTIFTTFVERKQQSEELRRSVLAVDLAHELGHQALMLYQLTDRILLTPLEAPVYSSVRRTERPAIFALHACVAAAYMIETCVAIERSPITSKIERDFSRNSISELVPHQRVGLESLRKSAKFTQIGQLILEDLERQLHEIRVQPCAHAIEPNLQSSSLSYFGLLAP